MQDQLGLNEALISVNKSNISTPIEIYHQTEECFGCPLEKLTGNSGASFDTFIVDTRYNIKLEVRQAPNSSCRFDNLAFNNHAQYRIEVSSGANESDTERLNCKLETIDDGYCLLCPFAILICILFGFSVFEWLFDTLIKSQRGQRIPSSNSSETEPQGDPVYNSASDLTAQRETSAEGQQAELAHDQQSSSDERDKHDEQACAQKNLPAPAVFSSDHLQDKLTSSQGRRIVCLDAFRGLTIAGMIFVNYGGAGYAQWQHKPWDGITLADFVFPFFIFSMGASIALSTRAQIKRAQNLKLSFIHVITRIIRRSLILMLLGICLNSKWIDYDQANGLSRLRLTGVLQRFSISYLVVALMYANELKFGQWFKAQSFARLPYLSRFMRFVIELLLAFNYLAIYIYMTFFYKYSDDCPIGYTGPGGQTEGGKYAGCTGGAAAWLDRVLIGENHTYNDHELKQIFKSQVSHDPEGILGYTTSILLTLIGLQSGKILMRRQNVNHKSRVLAFARASLLLAMSCALVLVIPINKRLWSLTFVLVTALVAFLIMALLYIVLDVYACKRTLPMRLFISAGKNALALYVGHSLVKTMLPWWFPISDPSTHLQLLLRLAWATLIWMLIAQYMALKRLFIRV